MQHATITADDQLLDNYLPQIRRIAARLRQRLPNHVEIEDLISAGTMGLLDALKRFDSSRHVGFWSYAAHRIRGAMLDSLRDLDWAPRQLRRSARAIETAGREVTRKSGRVASQQELAEQMDISIKDLHDLQAQLHNLELVSLDAPISAVEDAGTVADSVASDEPSPLEQCLYSEVRARLAQLLHELPARDRTLLELYYYEELSMKEVGEVFGIDESRVSQIHSMLMRQLRRQLPRLLPETTAPMKA